MMRTLLICHADAPVVRVGMAQWLQSFSELVGIVVLEEKRERKWKRIRREIRRTGLLRFVDVAAFRLHYRFVHAKYDAEWTKQQLAEMAERFQCGSESPDVPEIITTTPNSAAARDFIADVAPDVMIAGCKQILGRKTFELARTGTFVLHPGICPDYRNAHGGFWALAKGDPENVGMTLLQIDAGIDTGPIYGHFRQPFDGRAESHLRIQRRQTLASLDAAGELLTQIHEGDVDPLDVSGRPSAEFGQPWLSAYFRWKWGSSGRAVRTSSSVTTSSAARNSAEQPIETIF